MLTAGVIGVSIGAALSLAIFVGVLGWAFFRSLTFLGWLVVVGIALFIGSRL